FNLNVVLGVLDQVNSSCNSDQKNAMSAFAQNLQTKVLRHYNQNEARCSGKLAKVRALIFQDSSLPSSQSKKGQSLSDEEIMSICERQIMTRYSNINLDDMRWLAQKVKDYKNDPKAKYDKDHPSYLFIGIRDIRQMFKDEVEQKERE